MAGPGPAAPGALIGFVVMWLSVVWINGRGARALRQRIAVIEQLEEQR